EALKQDAQRTRVQGPQRRNEHCKQECEREGQAEQDDGNLNARDQLSEVGLAENEVVAQLVHGLSRSVQRHAPVRLAHLVPELEFALELVGRIFAEPLVPERLRLAAALGLVEERVEILQKRVLALAHTEAGALYEQRRLQHSDLGAP